MEEKQKNEPEFKGNLGFIWLIGILVILLGCVTVYTLKITADNKELKQAPTQISTQQQPVIEQVKTEEEIDSKTENNNISSNITPNSKYNYKLSKRTTNQAVREGYIEIMVDTKGDAYLYTVGNLDYEDDAQLKGKIRKIEKQFKSYPIEVEGSSKLKAYKLNMTGVLTVYHVYVGNGGTSYFIFVKEGGKLSYLSYDNLIDNGKFDLKDVKNIKNVIAIVENISSPYAINSDGDEIFLYDYIK